MRKGELIFLYTFPNSVLQYRIGADDFAFFTKQSPHYPFPKKALVFTCLQ